ncbi:ABC transporter substrate-binding protein [Mesosutterella sp. OilRF-GAM-744-9]|uniref:ABC transporter substrate-binding protein n=1 Tax=Mesosutterella porci TaxID=2915351 RepID=A0ABS9MNT4_9BURK|nr:ABC transporter substrate-binding protein [Mesosutterella sp. oilRF-744-WT-GAM-9]MCG5029910.1 ABC transporter substrate-binding protein [Mesosutterella sp. oilRF-744-WT-GAM-9]
MKFQKIAAALALAGFAACALAAGIPAQKFNKALHDRLPASIQKSGVIRDVVNGSFPPYSVVSPDKKVTGAVQDFSKALSEILGVKIEHTNVSSLSSTLIGLQSGRYDMALAPIGDYPNRQAKNDFVDYVQEYVVFAVKKGNPLKINGLEDTCGHRISVMAGGSAERVIRKASEVCVKAKKPPVTVLSFDTQTTSALAVRSGRADAFFSSQAPLTYFVSKNRQYLELAAVGKKNGFNDIYQGAVFAKNSPLAPVVLAAFQELFKNGTYKAIMMKYDLKNNMTPKPGKNLGVDVK